MVEIDIILFFIFKNIILNFFINTKIIMLFIIDENLIIQFVVLQISIWIVLPRSLVHTASSQRGFHTVLRHYRKHAWCVDRHELASYPMGERSYVNFKITVVYTVPLWFISKQEIFFFMILYIEKRLKIWKSKYIIPYYIKYIQIIINVRYM